MLQIAVTYVWSETETVEQFTQVFQALYKNDVPVWSQMAFSFGKSWYWAPAIYTILMGLALYRQKSKPILLAVAVSSVFSFLAMLYAMYPLHIMFI